MQKGPSQPVAVLLALLPRIRTGASRCRPGVGVHTGEAWVGVVGEPGAHDFTVLGDVPNTTARLGSAVGGGELAKSDVIAEVAGVDTSGLELRVLHVKGKIYPVNVWVEHGTPAFTEGKPVSGT